MTAPAPADAAVARVDGPVYAVGDIHGRYDLLVLLLERIVADVARAKPAQGATLVFLGDYVDRGPGSAEVLAALMWVERHAPFATVFLKGNHEQALLDYLDDPVRHEQWLRFGGRATLQSYGIAASEGGPSAAEHRALRDRIVDRMPASHLEFLRGLRLWHETPHFVLVHAGLRPGVPLERQTEKDLLWIREGFLEDRPPGPKRVIHGHSWTDDRPEVRAHRIGIDTGAFRTGVLTAARIVGPEVSFLDARVASSRDA